MYLILRKRKNIKPTGEISYGPSRDRFSSFLMLVNARSLGLALYDCTFHDEEETPTPEEKISKALDSLIRSARDYPPALARARHDVESMSDIADAETFRASSVSG